MAKLEEPGGCRLARKPLLFWRFPAGVAAQKVLILFYFASSPVVSTDFKQLVSTVEAGRSGSPSKQQEQLLYYYRANIAGSCRQCSRLSG
jgi:hypothetical protein